LLATAGKDIGPLASTEVVHRVMSYNPDCLWAFVALADALEQEDSSDPTFQPGASAFDRWDTVKALEMLGRNGRRSNPAFAPNRERRYRKKSPAGLKSARLAASRRRNR